MRFIILVAIIALTVSAHEVLPRASLCTWSDLLNYGAIKALLTEPSHNLKDTPVVSDCSTATKTYEVDLTKTHTTPASAVKGSAIELDVEGLCDDNITFSKVHLDVYWGGSLFHAEDVDMSGQACVAGKDYTFKTSFDIPSYAPSGKYDVKASFNGVAAASSSSNDTVVDCTEFKFTL
jgi:hypothetical protein